MLCVVPDTKIVMNVAALVLDMDDTINRTTHAMNKGLWQASSALWPDLDETTRAHQIEVYVRDDAGWFDRFSTGAIDFAAMRRGRLADMASRLGSTITDDQLEYFETTYRHSFMDTCAPWPDALALISQARKLSIPVAVLSNSSRQMTMAKARRLDVADQLVDVLGADVLGVGKPDVSAYLSACQRLGCEPSEVGYVDDSLRDATGGADARLQTVWLDRADQGYPPEGDTRQNLARVTSLDQIQLAPLT